jgi:hypothetical protein
MSLELRDQLRTGEPAILWLANFPSLNINHSVVAYNITPSRGSEKIQSKDGAAEDYTLSIYDPNCDATANGGRPATLKWNAATSTFTFNKTFYFPGGPVGVRHVFTDPWH